MLIMGLIPAIPVIVNRAGNFEFYFIITIKILVISFLVKLYQYVGEKI